MKKKKMLSAEEKQLKVRIQQLLLEKHMPIAELSVSESDRVMLGRQIRGTVSALQFDTIHRILTKFEDVSPDWLILGKGNMYRDENNSIFAINDVHGNSAYGDINVGGKINDSNALKKRVAELERDKDFLQAMLKSLTQEPAKTVTKP